MQFKSPVIAASTVNGTKRKEKMKSMTFPEIAENRDWALTLDSLSEKEEKANNGLDDKVNVVSHRSKNSSEPFIPSLLAPDVLSPGD